MGRQFFKLLTVGTAVTTIIASAGCTSTSAEPSDPSTSAVGSTQTTGSRPSSDRPGGGVGMAVNLVRFSGCDDVLNYVKTEALDRVGPYGLGGNEVLEYALEDGAPQGTTADSAEDTGSPAPSGSDIDDGLTSETGTNVQEAGIDEPDIIKTDGNRIITLSPTDTGSTLTVADISNRAPTVTGTLKLEPSAADMVLSGDRVVVFSHGGQYFGPVGSADAEQSFVDDASVPTWSAQTVITEISISGQPTVTNTVAVEGNYLSGRTVGTRLRVAVSSPPVSLPWVFPQGPAGEDRAEESNRQVIEDSTLADWLPDVSINGAEPTQLLDCDSIHRPAEFAGFDTISILDFDLGAGLGAATDAVGVMASGETTYSSIDRFYVASTNWNWNGPIPVEDTPGDDVSTVPEFEDATTDVHAFAISDTEPTTYVASGEVPGSLLNQFSMDSADGNLRVITTSTTPDGSTETFLRVLAEQGDRLTEIGSVGGLGKGEQLYSARLFDQIGFAVTYRQIDPLYVLDLADPANPRVTGELKIPGVSTYLHPIGDGRMLGVGAAATGEGRRTGLKVSLFDVSDVTNPTEIANWTLDDASSDAEYDAHAFQYSDGLLVLPVSNMTWGGGGEALAPSAVVLRIDDQITEVGRIMVDIPAVDSTSDCRIVDGDTTTEEYTLKEMWGDALFQVCGPDDVGGYGGYVCDSFSYDDMTPGTIAPDSASALGMGASDRLEVCYPGDRYWLDQIRRVISVNDTFYVLTPRRLQANDRSSLDLLGSIPLGS